MIQKYVVTITGKEGIDKDWIDEFVNEDMSEIPQEIESISFVNISEVKDCNLCKKELDTIDPLSKNCGGDCQECMDELEN